MSDFPTTGDLRSLLPASPARWFWTRLRVYLAAAAVAAVVCVGVAGYLAIEPSDRPAVWATSFSLGALLAVLMHLGLQLLQTHAFSRGLAGFLGSLSFVLGLDGGRRRRD